MEEAAEYVGAFERFLAELEPSPVEAFFTARGHTATPRCQGAEGREIALDLAEPVDLEPEALWPLGFSALPRLDPHEAVPYHAFSRRAGASGSLTLFARSSSPHEVLRLERVVVRTGLRRSLEGGVLDAADVLALADLLSDPAFGAEAAARLFGPRLADGALLELDPPLGSNIARVGLELAGGSPIGIQLALGTPALVDLAEIERRHGARAVGGSGPAERVLAFALGGGEAGGSLELALDADQLETGEGGPRGAAVARISIRRPPAGGPLFQGPAGEAVAALFRLFLRRDFCLAMLPPFCALAGAPPEGDDIQLALPREPVRMLRFEREPGSSRTWTTMRLALTAPIEMPGRLLAPAESASFELGQAVFRLPAGEGTHAGTLRLHLAGAALEPLESLESFDVSAASLARDAAPEEGAR